MRGQARASFDWIELLAVPIAICIMETQPIVLVLTLAAVALLGYNATLPLDEGSITLLLLGLHWWAKAVSTFTQRRTNTTLARFLELLGLFLAIVLTVVTHISLVHNIPTLFFTIILIIGFWYAGMLRVQKGPDDVYVLTSFKIGLGVLLGVLILTLLNFDPVPTILHDELTFALPTFFLSGLIGLSFTRIVMIRKESANSAQRGLQGDPTRGWLLILMLTWVIVMASTLAFEAFGFQSIVIVATFLWSALGIVANFFLLLLSPLLNLLSRFFPMVAPSKVIPLFPSTSINSHSPPFPYFAVIFLIARLVVLAILLVLLFFVIRAMLRRWRMAPDDESEEEIRESLSRQSILKLRRREQRQHQKTEDFITLESLDPNSIRARYRELLQELAWNGGTLARRANETPSEYEKRLLALLKKEPSIEAKGEDKPADPAMLDELTSAYKQERYGGKHPRLVHDSNVPAWIPRFVRRLSESNK